VTGLLDEKSWFVVQTNPQRERLVTDVLKGYEPYLPQIKTATGRIRPLFVSYVFVVATPEWSPIQNAYGVRTILKNGDQPARIPHRIIASWRVMERNGLVQLPDPPRFRAGEKLVVLRGTLKYRTVLHTGLSEREREHVLIDMLGQLVRINIATDDLVSESELAARNSLRRRRKTV
jgi:transcriptional antiterminator RfaH